MRLTIAFPDALTVAPGKRVCVHDFQAEAKDIETAPIAEAGTVGIAPRPSLRGFGRVSRIECVSHGIATGARGTGKRLGTIDFDEPLIVTIIDRSRVLRGRKPYQGIGIQDPSEVPSYASIWVSTEAAKTRKNFSIWQVLITQHGGRYQVWILQFLDIHGDHIHRLGKSR